MTACFRIAKTALEDPQHITVHNRTGGKIYRAGFLAEWGPHCPVPEAIELLLAGSFHRINKREGMCIDYDISSIPVFCYDMITKIVKVE